MKHQHCLRTLAGACVFLFLLAGCAPDASESQTQPTASAEQTEPASTAEKPAADTAQAAPPTQAQAPAPAPTPAKPRPPAPAKPAQPVICADCGTVAAITEVQQKGQGTGAGAVIGAVAGGVAGHQVGGGRGKDVATVAGAILGAMAGHEVEKRVRSTTTYDVRVAMEDGSQRVINVSELGGLTVGAKVRVDGNTIYLR